VRFTYLLITDNQLIPDGREALANRICPAQNESNSPVRSSEAAIPKHQSQLQFERRLFGMTQRT
jgi:hypothetical protein